MVVSSASALRTKSPFTSLTTDSLESLPARAADPFLPASAPTNVRSGVATSTVSS